jgi:hypothetical protein
MNEGFLESMVEECLKGSFLVKGEYLLLQPRRRAADFAIVDPNQDGVPQGSIESVFWNADSGYRAGVGYRLPDNGWEIGATYTYFRAGNTRALAAPPGGTLYATLTHPGFVDAVDTALGSSALNYNVVDVEAAHCLRVSDTVCLSLSGGGRFAQINQTLEAIYNGQTANQSLVSSPVRFNGAGIRVGGEGQWTLGRGLALYANAHGSLLTGDFRTSLTETANAGAFVITDVSDRFRKVIPVTELGVGVAWHNESLHVRVGYEIANWIGMVDSPDFVHDFTNKLSHRVSDLSLEGLSAEVGVDF